MIENLETKPIGEKEENKPEPITPEKVQEFFEKVSSIDKQLKIANSLRRKFVLALVMGFGTVVGATILVAIAVYFFSLLSHTNISPLDRLNTWLVNTLQRK